MANVDTKTLIEDYALSRVPLEERKSWLNLAWNTMGITSTLVQLLIGAIVTFTAGIAIGILAAVIITLVGAFLGWLVGRISLDQGLSSTVVARYHGLGSIGSIIASGIFGFMILGMLALENALLYQGFLFYFKIPNNIVNEIVIYGILSIAWVILAAYGMKLVIKVSSVTLVAFLVVLLYMVIAGIVKSGMPIGEVLGHGAVFPGGTPSSHFITVINLMIGSAGALALVDADYGRYAKSSRDVFLMALAGNIMMDLVILITGSILVYTGFATVQKYYIGLGMPAAQASQAALNNVAATFIIMGGLAGTLLMILAQSKAQVLNTYSGSLSLANFFDVLCWRPGRLIMVILGNIIGLVMIACNILGLINNWLTVLGVITTSLAVVMVADYYIVQKKTQDMKTLASEAINWSGVISIVFGSVLAMYLFQENIFPVPFVTACIISVVLYPILRLYLLKPKVSEYKDSIIGI